MINIPFLTCSLQIKVPWMAFHISIYSHFHRIGLLWLFYINRIYMYVFVYYIWFISCICDIYNFIYIWNMLFQHYIMGTLLVNRTWILLMTYYVKIWRYKFIQSSPPIWHSHYILFFCHIHGMQKFLGQEWTHITAVTWATAKTTAGP